MLPLLLCCCLPVLLLVVCGKKNKPSPGDAGGTNSKTMDKLPPLPAAKSKDTPPGAAATKTAPEKTSDKGKQESKVLSKMDGDKKDEKRDEKKDGEDEKKDATPADEPKLAVYPSITMPTKSTRKRKEDEHEKDKKAKIAEGFFQSKSDVDDTLEAVQSLGVEQSAKSRKNGVASLKNTTQQKTK